MTISTTIATVTYDGDGTTTEFDYTFKILAEGDLTVIIRASNGTETVKTLTTHYTLDGVGDANGGTVTFTSGNIPASTEKVILIRDTAQTQSIDYIENDPFPAETHEEGLDRSVILAQELQEEVDRCIKISRTNTMTDTSFTVGATDRANKILAFDTSGEISVTQELGTFRGSDTTTTTAAYNARDLIKSTSAAQLNNIYLAKVDTVVGALLTDTTKFELIIDAAAAASSESNASDSAADAEKLAINAEDSQFTLSDGTTTGFSALHHKEKALDAQTASETAKADAETAQTAAEAAQTAAEAAQTAAESAQSATEAALDTFDDKFLGSKSTDPTVDNDGNALTDGALYFDTTNNVMKVYDLGNTEWKQLTPTSAEQTNIDTVSGDSADIQTLAGISSDISTTAGVSSDIETLADIEDGTDATDAIQDVAGVASDVTTVAGQISPTNNISTISGISSSISTVAAISSNVTTVANNVTDVNNFANVYRIGATDPTTSLDEGDLFFNTTDNVLRAYDGSTWQNITFDTDVKTKVSSNDTTAGFLNGKLVAGTNITLTENSDGGNETLTISTNAVDEATALAIALG